MSDTLAEGSVEWSNKLLNITIKELSPHHLSFQNEVKDPSIMLTLVLSKKYTTYLKYLSKNETNEEYI